MGVFLDTEGNKIALFQKKPDYKLNKCVSFD